jgi:hypothetical protein
MPPPSTGVAGHSYGALHAGILAGRREVRAIASLSGEWIEPFSGPSPLVTVSKPWLLTWGTEPFSEVDANLPDQLWNRISRPKHRAVFPDAMHFDYLHNVQFPCRDGAQGPCQLVGQATDDLVTMFFARYLPPEGSPELPDRIPADLRPRPSS